MEREAVEPAVMLNPLGSQVSHAFVGTEAPLTSFIMIDST